MAERRCLVTGCGRRVRQGSAMCWQHRRTRAGRAVEAEVRRLTQSVLAVGALGGADAAGRARRERAAERFRRRVERGDFGALLDEPVRRVMEQAAAERGLGLELGALRVALARVLTEEEDPLRQAYRLAALATAIVRVSQEQRAVRQGMESELHTAMWQVLAELDGEGEPPSRDAEG